MRETPRIPSKEEREQDRKEDLDELIEGVARDRAEEIRREKLMRKIRIQTLEAENKELYRQIDVLHEKLDNFRGEGQ